MQVNVDAYRYQYPSVDTWIGGLKESRINLKQSFETKSFSRSNLNWNKSCSGLNKLSTMENLFQISMHIKTPGGFETYGRFDLGSDREQATTIVGQLRGTDDIAEHSILYMDFTEIRNGIPLPYV